ncbi:membrane hypothetical protein [Candidatus Sulfopaludibacter sp. SbA6]|nr:membrane hypothetical protein [Candidatus Sulfopaludibacter sp. SbA6]
MMLTTNDASHGVKTFMVKVLAIFSRSLSDALNVWVFSGIVGLLGVAAMLFVPEQTPGENAAVVAVPIIILFMIVRLVRIAMSPMSASELNKRPSATSSLSTTQWLIAGGVGSFLVMVVSIVSAAVYWWLGLQWASNAAQLSIWLSAVLVVVFVCLALRSASHPWWRLTVRTVMAFMAIPAFIRGKVKHPGSRRLAPSER